MEQGWKTAFISRATWISRSGVFSRLSRVERCDQLAVSAMGVKLREDTSLLLYKCHHSNWVFNETFRVNTSELSFLARTRRQMALLEAAQDEGKADSLE